MDRKKLKFDTRTVQGASPVEMSYGGVATPIYAVSTFAFRDTAQGAALFAKEEQGYIYSRIANPTNSKFEANLALIEGGEAGLSFSSGMGAINCIVMHHCGAGDRLLTQGTLYGGTHDLFKSQYPRYGIEVDSVRADDTAAFAERITPDTKLVFIETPANPTLTIVDIETIAKIAHEAGIPLVVDNTFATPYLQRPLELGADFVMHSCTKYIGGHGDAVGGAIVGSEEAIADMRASTYKDFGANPSPFNSYLFIRGLKTLSIRVERHCENATKIAEYLHEDPKVDKVYYPGLASHPGHELAAKQMNGKFGGMIGFDVPNFDAACKLLDSLEICVLAVSLGDVITLIEHPASTTHSSYSPEDLEAIGLKNGYIRISVGIEDADDLIADLEQGLSKI